MGEDLYACLSDHLGQDLPLVGLYDIRELAWIASLRESGETSSGYSIERVATLYLERIQKANPNGPYVLGGFSTGGAVAFEVARKLRGQGKKVDLVVLFDTVALGSLASMTFTQHLSQRWKNFQRYGLENQKMKLKKNLGWAVKKLKATTSKLSRKPAVEDKRRDLFESRVQYFREALISYRPAPYDGDVLLFVARDAIRPPGFIIDDSLGWEKYVKGKLTIRSLPGDHEDILREPNVRTVAKTIIQQTRQSVSRHLEN